MSECTEWGSTSTGPASLGARGRMAHSAAYATANRPAVDSVSATVRMRATSGSKLKYSATPAHTPPTSALRER